MTDHHPSSADRDLGDGDSGRPRVGNALPENELPKWLFGQVRQLGRRMRMALHPMPYRQLSQFAHDLAMCLNSTADVPRALELCLKPLRRSKLGDAWSGAVTQVRAGAPLTEALRAGQAWLPSFYLPVIEAGEQTGRVVEAFRFLESHCRLLAGPAAAVRNLWLIPVVILIAGSVLKWILYAAAGSFSEAATLLGSELASWLRFALIVAIVMWTPIRLLFDQLRLAIPWVGSFERELALHRFFRIMALMYSVGAYRVEEMIRTAARSVSNQAARADLLKAAEAIEQGEGVDEAFRRVGILTSDEQTTIEVGELSGKLETTFEQIADDCGRSLMARLNYIQPLLFRLVMAVVVLSLISAALSLVFRSPTL